MVNVTLPRVKREKLAKKRAYVLKWKITAKDGPFDVSVETIRKVCDGNLTCFDVRCVYFFDTCRPAGLLKFHSSDGRLLAFGASDYSLAVLDSNTLTVSQTVQTVYYDTNRPKLLAIVVHLESTRVPSHHPSIQSIFKAARVRWR